MHTGLYAYGLVGKRTEPLKLELWGIDQQHKVYTVEGKEATLPTASAKEAATAAFGGRNMEATLPTASAKEAATAAFGGRNMEVCVVVSLIDIDVFQNRAKQLFAELTRSTDSAEEATVDLLQAHEDIVESLMKETAIVPFRFGTVLKDEEAASKLLKDKEEEFQQLLAKCTGRAEWGVKVYVDTQAFTERLLQSERRYQALAEQQAQRTRGAAYLFGKKIAQEAKDEAAARLAQIVEALFEELSEEAHEANMHVPVRRGVQGDREGRPALAGTNMILNAVYLVENERAARFCERTSRLQKEYAAFGFDLELTGPWPPYSFIIE